MKKIVHELYLYLYFLSIFHFNEWQNDDNFLYFRKRDWDSDFFLLNEMTCEMGTPEANFEKCY